MEKYKNCVTFIIGSFYIYGTVINKLSLMTGKDVSNDLEAKIIDTIKEDKVPKNVKDMF